MTEHTFLFVTDTHIGNDGTGWGHHPLRPDLLAQIIPALSEYAQSHAVAFVLHGGDLIDNGLKSQIDQAQELWRRLEAPWYLCLGNHDLAQPESYAHWLSEWPDAFAGPAVDYVINCDIADVYVLANVWPGETAEPSHWWNREYPDCPGILRTQLEWLDEALAARSDRPAILVTHAALDPLPAELTGLGEATHVPAPTYAGPLCDLLARHNHVKLVLSGHCHATCLTRHGQRTHATTSAFCEPPFQMRRVSITPSSITLETLSPIGCESLDVQWNRNNLWSSGRPSDLKAVISF